MAIEVGVRGVRVKVMTRFSGSGYGHGDCGYGGPLTDTPQGGAVRNLGGRGGREEPLLFTVRIEIELVGG
jgi:hypothetical protein